MTWKDIKLATLQKMFSAEGSNIPTDDSTRDYLAGMPYAANEGLLMMCTGKKHIIRTGGRFFPICRGSVLHRRSETCPHAGLLY